MSSTYSEASDFDYRPQRVIPNPLNRQRDRRRMGFDEYEDNYGTEYSSSGLSDFRSTDRGRRPRRGAVSDEFGTEDDDMSSMGAWGRSTRGTSSSRTTDSWEDSARDMESWGSTSESMSESMGGSRGFGAPRDRRQERWSRNRGPHRNSEDQESTGGYFDIDAFCTQCGVFGAQMWEVLTNGDPGAQVTMAQAARLIAMMTVGGQDIGLDQIYQRHPTDPRRCLSQMLRCLSEYARGVLEDDHGSMMSGASESDGYSFHGRSYSDPRRRRPGGYSSLEAYVESLF